jgi:pimeloyl-ACP methyl ester carboxylesterase
MAKLYALLVGINEYANPNITKLDGCVNDIAKVAKKLQEQYKDAFETISIKTLENAEATYQGFIDTFQSHLGQAGEEDTVYFHFSGHGSRQDSPKPTQQESKWETFVLYDSRTVQGETPVYDMVDKEFAVLLNRIHPKAHVICVLDRCHSGSGSRNSDEPKKRHAEGRVGIATERNTNYFGFHEFQILKDAHEQEFYAVPSRPHILLAACHSSESAYEVSSAGVFTTALLKALEQTASPTYSDLHTRIKAVIRNMTALHEIGKQTPQIEPIENFNAQTTFITNKPVSGGKRYLIHFDKTNDKNQWIVNRGAVHGLPQEGKISLDIFAQDTGEILGCVSLKEVDFQTSTLDLKTIHLDTEKQYAGAFVDLPVEPILVYINEESSNHTVDYEAIKELSERIDSPFYTFTNTPEGAEYEIKITHFLDPRANPTAKQGAYEIHTIGEKSEYITGVWNEGKPSVQARNLLTFLESITNYQQKLKLQNDNSTTRYNPEDIELKCIVEATGEEIPIHQALTQPLVILPMKAGEGETKAEKKILLKLTNKTEKTIYARLHYFSDDYAIMMLHGDQNVKINAGEEVILRGKAIKMTLLKDKEKEVDYFQLIASEEYLDPADFEEQKPIPKNNIKPFATMGVDLDDEPQKIKWLVKTLEIQTIWENDTAVGKAEATLPESNITILPHETLSAKASLETAFVKGRGLEGKDDLATLALHKMTSEIANLGKASRSTNQPQLLQLHNINKENVNLQEKPLHIRLEGALEEGEMYVPVAITKEGMQVIGFSDAKNPQIVHITDLPTEKTRSLLGSLGMAFLKIHYGNTKSRDIELHWIEYKPDGETIRHNEGIADKVKNAKNILMLIHGIIGDTIAMTKSMQFAQELGYDLVLTCDYENLNTPITKISEKLQEGLANVGIDAHYKQAGKKFTIVAHSMGGLVSRYFIEKLKGYEVVSHLVMAGTPNGGSEWHKIKGVIDIAQMGISWGLTYLTSGSYLLFKKTTKIINSFLGTLKGVSTVDSAGDKYSVTLNMMAPQSDFIKGINNPDNAPIPQIRYSIIAGNNTDPETQKWYYNTASYLLYKDVENDVAVATTAIVDVPTKLDNAPQINIVSAHHMNYFDQEQSRDVLKKVLA